MRSASGPRKKRARHRKRFTLVTPIATFVSFALVGWIMVVNLHNTNSLTYHSTTADVIRSRQKTINQLQKDIKDQAKQVETFQSLAKKNTKKSDDVTVDSTTTNLPALEGQGITVTLSDSQKWEQVAKEEGVNPNDYVVHQQDIEAVVNALWSGNAEAITIQDERLLPTSAIKCVGNVLLLNGKQFAPPYKISAIGDPDTMKDAIDSSESIKIYKQYVEADGLGWQLTTNTLLHFKAVSVSPQPMKYAVVEKEKEKDEQDER